MIMSSDTDYVILDLSNLLYRSYYANKDEDSNTIAGYAHHVALNTLNKYYKKFKPRNGVIMTFDRSSWRKEYTASDLCLSGKLYKGNRRKNMTPSEKQKLKEFRKHLSDFEQIMRERTGVVCLASDLLEADDLIAGFVQSHSEFDNVIVSADKDMIQLLRYENTRLIDPASDNDRTLDDWEGDADLFMFEKCIRGDAGDNVGSAFPRVRKTRIFNAYHDDYERVNILNETWTDQTKKQHIVSDLFNENKLLMDLSAQPTCVRRKIDETIEYEMLNPGKFCYFSFLRFLGKYELKRISEKLEQYVPMLSGAGR